MIDIDDRQPDNFIDEPAAGPAVNPDDPFAPLRPDAPGQTPVPPSHRWRRPLLIAAATVVAALGIAMWLRYFRPHTVETRASGYITNVERRGMLFRTFEGEMIREDRLTDTTRIYSRDFTFSVADDSLARLMQQYQSTGRRVTVVYKQYYGMVPWRGASRNVATELVVSE